MCNLSERLDVLLGVPRLQDRHPHIGPSGLAAGRGRKITVIYSDQPLELINQTYLTNQPNHPQHCNVQVLIGGGAGFIGSHLAKRLKAEGWYVVCADWKENEFMKPEASSAQNMLLGFLYSN